MSIGAHSPTPSLGDLLGWLARTLDDFWHHTNAGLVEVFWISQFILVWYLTFIGTLLLTGPRFTESYANHPHAAQGGFSLALPWLSSLRADGRLRMQEDSASLARSP